MIVSPKCVCARKASLAASFALLAFCLASSSRLCFANSICGTARRPSVLLCVVGSHRTYHAYLASQALPPIAALTRCTHAFHMSSNVGGARRGAALAKEYLPLLFHSFLLLLLQLCLLLGPKLAREGPIELRDPHLLLVHQVIVNQLSENALDGLRDDALGRGHLPGKQRKRLGLRNSSCSRASAATFSMSFPVKTSRESWKMASIRSFFSSLLTPFFGPCCAGYRCWKSLFVQAHIEQMHMATVWISRPSLTIETGSSSALSFPLEVQVVGQAGRDAGESGREPPPYSY